MTNGTPRVLLTVSGTIDPDLAAEIAAGRRPRADYLVLAQAFDADLLDYAEAARTSGAVARLLGRLAGPDLLLALACYVRRRRYGTIFTDGEQVGMPYALLCWLSRRRPRHVMIGHVLTPRKKALLHRLARLHRRIDVLVVYASAQRTFAIEELGYPPERVVLTPFMVDTEFWQLDPGSGSTGKRPMICAVGLERRDYPTLVEAIRDVDVDVVVAAASPWSKRASTTTGLEIPANVLVRGFDQHELRDLYAAASFVVVPLEETDFQAGITTILEAMSMGKAVVCSLTTGQTDAIIGEETGLYVPPGDIDAIRGAIRRLLADPDGSARMGDAGRRWVLEHAEVSAYAERLRATLDQ